MDKKDYSTFTTEQLIAEEKKINIAFRVLAGVLILQVCIGVFLAFQKRGFSVFTVLPVAFLPILIMNKKSLEAIRAEIATRS
jgi:hypothetical protein